MHIIERWEDIPGFEGLYQASTKGRIKNLRTGRILKKANYKGYHRITLFKDGKKYTCKVHRLVAQTFIPNPDNLPCVNHMDCDPSNNRADNLEWCTYSYNTNYGDANERRAKNNKPHKPKTVYQYSLDGEFIGDFKSTRKAAAAYGMCHSSIERCCNGKIQQSGGFIWRYEKL